MLAIIMGNLVCTHLSKGYVYLGFIYFIARLTLSNILGSMWDQCIAIKSKCI
jgi:hypothetical protein